MVTRRAANPRGYDAFLSYGHAADGRLAPAVARCLHRLAKPWNRRRAMRVFRDQASLSANPDLWATIEAALGNSRYFVLLASPDGARSPWVGREVAYWRAHRHPDTFLIALTAGEIHWDHRRGDFDWARTTALPEQLRGWFAAEPLWVDLTWARSVTHLSPGNARFRDTVGTLAAAIHGIPKDDLDGEDLRQHRLATRLRRAVVLLMTVLLAISLVATANARAERGTAQRERHVADQQRELATSRALVAEARNLRDTQPLTSLRLSIAAVAVDPTTRARADLVATLLATRLAGRSTVPGQLSQAVFAPGARTLATAGRDGGTLRLWDTSDPTRLRLLSAPTGWAGNPVAGHDISFSGDGRTLAAAGPGRTVIVWDVADPTRPRRWAVIPGPVAVRATAFSPDGTTLATMGGGAGDDGTLGLWDLRDRARPTRLAVRTGLHDLSAATFSPDGHLLVTATYDLEIEETATRQTLRRGSGATVWDVSDRRNPRALTRVRLAHAAAFSPDGRLLAISYERFVRLYDLTDPARPRPVVSFVGATDALTTIAISRDGATLAAGSYDHTASLWDIHDPARPRRLATLADHATTVRAVAFAGDRTTLVTADEGLVGASDQDATVDRWNVAGRAAPALMTRLPGGIGALAGVAVSPDGRTLALAGYGGVSVWDVADPTRPIRTAVDTGHTGSGANAAFSPDGTTLATGSQDGTTVVWDVTDRRHPRPVTTLTPTRPATSVSAVAFTARAGVLVTLAGEYFKDGQAVLWDVHDRTRPRRLATISPVDGAFGRLALTPDGRALLLGGTGRSAATSGTHRWDISDPRKPVRHAVTDHVLFQSQVAFSPDGKTVAAGSGGALTLSYVPDRSPTRAVVRLAGGPGWLTRVRFHPEGRLVATANRDGTAVLWDIADPARSFAVRTLSGHTDSVLDEAFGPGGRWLVTASQDGTAIIWNLGDLPGVVADATGLACHIAGSGLTRDQWRTYLPGTPYQPTCP